MSFNLALIEHKIEFFEAFSMQELEKKIQLQVNNNVALMLEPSHVEHQTLYHPEYNKVIYTAVVHFKLKQVTS